MQELLFDYINALKKQVERRNRGKMRVYDIDLGAFGHGFDLDIEASDKVKFIKNFI